MALTLALATIRMATLHASHPTLHVLSPSGELEGGQHQFYYNDESLKIIVQNTLF